MGGQAPKPRFVKFPCKGSLNELLTPADVGGGGLTACQNLIYNREGAWGKRPGAGQTVLPTGGSTTPVSGFRWYRAFPSPLTALVLYAQNHIYTGKDAHNLTDHGHFALSGATAPGFCSARDPQSNGGNGSDTIIIAGITLPTGSFGVGAITITGAPGSEPTTSSAITVTATNNGTNSVTTTSYQILGSDTPASICQGLANLLNQTAAFLNQGSFTPYIGESYFTVANPTQPFNAGPPNAICHLGAQMGGAAGNLITYGVTWTYGDQAGGTTGTLVVLVNQTNVPAGGGLVQVDMTGGGQPWQGLARCDLLSSDVDIVGLSYMAPNAFTGCVTWHQHVWAWGDPQNPDTVFACDINQPEAWTFMIENGGMMKGPSGQNGGYTIGAGDGDPGVQTCIPLGNALYVFKTNSIYVIEGYDFQPGEYQFSITPQVVGYGIPSPYCVAVLENQLVFWSGRKFLRLMVGAYEPEHIGRPIPLTEGLVSKGQQPLLRAIAGDYQVLSLMNGQYVESESGSPATILLKSMALFAFDPGSGLPNAVVAFDDDATEAMGTYAWSRWSGWNVGCWILYGQGPNPAGTDADKPLLYFVNQDGTTINLFGGNASQDFGTNPIPWMAQTGWVDFASAELLKNQHRLMLNVEATAGALLTATLVPGQIIPGSGQVLPYSTTPVPLTYPPTIAPENGEAFNELEQYIEPQIQSKSILLQFAESGASGAGFEMLNWSLDLDPEEAFGP